MSDDTLHAYPVESYQMLKFCETCPAPHQCVQEGECCKEGFEAAAKASPRASGCMSQPDKHDPLDEDETPPDPINDWLMPCIGILIFWALWYYWGLPWNVIKIFFHDL